MIALEKNRVVSEQPHVYLPVNELNLPEKGKVVHLRKVGFVTVFRTVDKHGTARYYAQSDPRKKAHEDRLRPLQARAQPPVEDRVLPPRAQGSLPRAQASRVEVTVRKLPEGIRMTIEDDGKSFQVQRVLLARGSKRLGLLGMRERLEMVGGRLEVESAPGKGTVITASIPFPKVRATGNQKLPVAARATKP